MDKRKRRGLKPCPWCGSVPILKEDPMWTVHTYQGHTVSHGYVGAYEYYYQCSNEECNAIAPYGKFNTIYDTSDTAKLKAREAWQTRADNENT